MTFMVPPPGTRNAGRNRFAFQMEHFILTAPVEGNTAVRKPRKSRLNIRAFRGRHQEGGMRMRVLVTGHTGFIGAVMVPMLQRAGHDVVGMDAGFYDECSFPGTMAKAPSLRRDLRDVERGDLDGFDA